MARTVRFDCYEVDLESGQLLKRGLRIRLRDQSFQVLAALLEQPGNVVSREDLRRRLWHDDVFVDFENNLNIVVARLREALGDSSERPRFIETVPKRGYRFMAEVSEPPAHPATPVRRARLLVLPFVNLGGDPVDDCFSDAITDEIITALAGLDAEPLAVIARTTAMRYKGSHKDIAQIGRELAVDYVVEGSVHGAGDRVAINSQLIQVSDQTHLLARRYETSRHDPDCASCRVADDVAARLGLAPTATSRGARGTSGVPVPGRPVPDLVAYNEYILARRCMDKLTAQGLAQARQHLERAINRDPDYAAAYDALAETYWYLGYFGFLRPRDSFSAGIVHALRALEIDNRRAETHALLGQFHKTADYNWPEVHREMALARQLDANSPVVRLRSAVSELMPHGRIDEAVAELVQALELDPLSNYLRCWLAVMLLFARNYERALEEGRRAVELDPGNWPAYLAISASQRYCGSPREAIAVQRECVERSGNAAAMLGWLGLTLASAGEIDEARAILQQLLDRATTGYVPATSVAWIYLGLREVDTAFRWLDRAVEECDQYLMPIKSYLFLDPIRSDPRFAALLRKMRLES